MEAGFYTKNPIDWESLRVPFFRFPSFIGPCGWGCGANALKILTGIEQYKIAKENRSDDYQDEFMVNFLKKRNYKVVPVTQCSMSNTPIERILTNKIRYDHVLLISQILHKNEASWIICYNNKLMQNNVFSEIFHL